MVLGEGGALLIMETEEHAKARGARILARLLGAATTSDGYDAMRLRSRCRTGSPRPDARHRTGGSRRPATSTSINAHAAGTVDGDLVEATALQKVVR